jgi:hypothetical protein
MSESTTVKGGMHHEEDFARLTDSQLKVRQRITTRRLVRALLPEQNGGRP